jgi:hypothetical protein
MRLFFPTMAAALALVHLGAGEMNMETAQRSVPEQVDESIRELLQSEAVQLREGDQVRCEFWFVSTVPLESEPESPGAAFNALKETTLLGVLAVRQEMRDYKNEGLPVGVYTMRYALQPQDGNHLGTALYPYFVVLVPAEKDLRPDRFRTARALVNASGRANPTEHPFNLSLRPPSTEDGPFPSLQQPEPDHETVLVKLPATAGETETHIIFELVYKGAGTH